MCVTINPNHYAGESVLRLKLRAVGNSRPSLMVSTCISLHPLWGIEPVVKLLERKDADPLGGHPPCVKTLETLVTGQRIRPIKLRTRNFEEGLF